MHHDIIIAGGGAAGSIAAWLAAERGLDVLLVEQKARGEYHPCSGVFAAHGLTGFPGLPPDAFERDMVTMRVMSPAADAVLDAREFGKTLGKVILRSTFDGYMLEQAGRKGALLLEETTVRDVAVKDDGVQVYCRDAAGIESEHHGGVLLLATGTRGFHLHRKVGLGTPPVVESVIAEFESSERHVEETLSSGAYHYYLNKRVTSIGPFWIACRKDTFNAGIIDHAARKDTLVATMTRDPRVKDLFAGARPRTWPGMTSPYMTALIPAAPLKVPYTDRVIALGDAAGLPHQFYYEGVWEARLSAKHAVDTIARLKDEGKPPVAANLAGYKALLGRHLVNSWLRSGRKNSYMFWQAQDNESLWTHFCETMARSKAFRRLMVECYEVDYAESNVDYDFEAGQLIFQHLPAWKKLTLAPLFLKIGAMK